MTQGSPALRANPGLKDEIPLGFDVQAFEMSFSSCSFALKGSSKKTL
jgi:hypothetical protein